MPHDSQASRDANDEVLSSDSHHSNELGASDHGKEETLSTSRINSETRPQITAALQNEKENSNTPPSELRQNLFMVFITLTQLVQMIPLGAGINSGLAIGQALGATNIQSVWIVASYPLTQGSFVLIGKLSFFFFLLYSFTQNHKSQISAFERLTSKNLFYLIFFSFIRWPSGCRLWSQECLHRRLCVVASLGFRRWILQQPGLDVHYESSVRYRWRPDDSKYCRLVGHHLPAR